ncbi:MAG: molecular chaperone, partial [Terrimesophilobacter sp.]
RQSRALGRASRVRVTVNLIVVPDEALSEPITRIGRKNDSAIVRLSVLPMVLRDGLGGQRLSIEDVFDVRSRLQHSIQFV